MNKEKIIRLIKFPSVNDFDFIWIYNGKNEPGQTEFVYNNLLKSIYTAATTLAIT